MSYFSYMTNHYQHARNDHANTTKIEDFQPEVLKYTSNIQSQSINTTFILYAKVYMSGLHVST